MSFQISCPECGHRFTLKTVKPGTFKLACTSCKKPFGLVVREGDPPELVVKRLSKPGTAAEPAETFPATRRPAAETMGDVAPAGTGSGGATGKPPAPEREPGTVDGLQQTMETPSSRTAPSRPSGTGIGSLDQTLEGSALAGATARSRTVDQPGQSRPAGGVSGPGLDETTAGPQSPTRAASVIGADGAEIPVRLGGYRILSELGRGGMGAVYLANQLTLDRKVALKTIRGGWTANKRAVARFIREAYAAAQLTHHNVVQIYDLGEDRGTNFFSMELVSGGSLQDLLKKHGRIDPRTAGSLMIQAARGLKFAHDNGMVHRDIKPANLMLTSDGLVKVADLGLVKTPSQADDLPIEEGDVNPALSSARSNVTDAGSSMGTPAYMAPEQAADATSVDHRADIYSLGCTFYALLTGKAPFDARTVKEMMQMHRTQPFPRARDSQADVPEAMDRIIARMVAKRPDERYQDLGEAIADLERALAEGDSRKALTSEQYLGRMAEIVRRFNASPLLPVRRLAPLLLGLVIAALFVVLMMTGRFRAASAVLVGGLAFPVALSALVSAMEGISPVGQRLRAVVLGSRWTEWLTWGVGAILIGAVAVVLGLAIWWLLAVAAAVGLAAAWYFGLTVPIARQRAGALEAAQKVLRSLRVAGHDEGTIRDFVADAAGKDWEEFFEAQFGYDAMRESRQRLAASGKGAARRRHAPWRDAIVDRLEAVIQARKAGRDQSTLARAEQAGLVAAGMSAAEARQIAAANAASLVDAAWQVRMTRTEVDKAAPDAAVQAKRERIKAMLAAARSGPRPEPLSFARRAREAILNQLLGGKLRFLLGAALLAGVAFWMRQSGFLEAGYWEKLGAEVAAVKDSVQAGGVAALQKMEAPSLLTGEFEPLRFPVVGCWFRSLAPGLVGLLVLVSALATGWRYSLVVIPAVLFALVGPGYLPSLGFAQGGQWLAALIACGMIVGGGLAIRQLSPRDW